jgi:hypothetical protein
MTTPSVALHNIKRITEQRKLFKTPTVSFELREYTFYTADGKYFTVETYVEDGYTIEQLPVWTNGEVE